MPDQVLKLKEIEDFFRDITCKMLGMDPETEESNDKVRIAWPTEGAPAASIDKDIVYLRITPVDDKLARELNIIYYESKEDNKISNKKTGYTRVHKIDWTLYGPNSYDNADIIRHSIFDYDYMIEFRTKNLFLITDVPMPTRLPEYFASQWWERTDLTASFNESVIREKKIPYILSGDVRVLKNR